MTESLPDGMTLAEVAALRAAAKEELRKRLAGLRRAISAETRALYARAICQRVIEHEAFQRARVVLLYSALRFEPDVSDIVDAALTLGKTVALPRTIPETRGLMLHRFVRGDELVESGFVVKEPLPHAPQIAPADVDLVLVPGLGFDARGQRLGYGQGYYDRLLPQLPKATRFGIAFELSLLVEVPSTPLDVPVHVVLTERRALSAST